MKLSEKSLHLAAQCWCDEETKNIQMDPYLATAFAKRLDKKDEIIKIMREALESMLICANAVDPRFSYKRVAKRALAAVEKLEKE